jgi:glutathione S-transferase
MLTVWGRHSSFNLQKVMWLVDELGLPHKHVEVGGKFGGLDTPEFLAMNPHGRVPVLQDGETVIWESHTILRYLAARYGGPQLWPEDPAKRSLVDRWMDWSHTTLQPDFLIGVFWGFYRTPADKRDMPRVKAAIARTNRDLAQLDRQLAGKKFLLGDTLSLADIPAGTSLYRYYGLEIERPPLPNVERWYRALQERLPYRAHVMLPFDELFGRLID